MLLDNFVVDVEGFITSHPGGQFVLRQAVGADISKYFFGGYCMEDNMKQHLPTPGHTHSNYARIIVNSLVVAMYEKDILTETVFCRVNEDATYPVNKLVST